MGYLSVFSVERNLCSTGHRGLIENLYVVSAWVIEAVEL